MHLFIGRRERLGRGNRAGLARGLLQGVMIRLMPIAIGAGRDANRPIVRRGDAELGGSPSGGDLLVGPFRLQRQDGLSYPVSTPPVIDRFHPLGEEYTSPKPFIREGFCIFDGINLYFRVT